MITPAGNRGDGGGRGVQLALLPEPLFSPIWPSPSSIPGIVLSLLLSGRTLTHPDFIKLHGSWRLSEYVRILRSEMGWPVEAHRIPIPNADFTEKYIAEYFLPAWVFDEVEVQHG